MVRGRADGPWLRARAGTRPLFAWQFSPLQFAPGSHEQAFRLAGEGGVKATGDGEVEIEKFDQEDDLDHVKVSARPAEAWQRQMPALAANPARLGAVSLPRADHNQGRLGQACRRGAWSPDEDERRTPDPRGVEGVREGASRALSHASSSPCTNRRRERQSFPVTQLPCRRLAAPPHTPAWSASGKREPSSGTARAAWPSEAAAHSGPKISRRNGGALWLTSSESP